MRLVGHFGPGLGEHAWCGFFGWLLPLVFVGLLVGIAVWVVARSTGERPRASAGLPPAPGWTPAPVGPRPDAAVEQARLRYARGEIGRTEFLRVSRDLGAPEPADGIEPDTAHEELGPDG